MIKMIVLTMVFITLFSGCISPTNEGLATITDITLPSQFTTGELTQVVISVKNDGLVSSYLYAKLVDSDTNEEIQHLASSEKVNPEYDCVLTFTFQRSQTTDFSGIIYAGHKTSTLDDQSNILIQYTTTSPDEYENFNTYLHLNDVDNHINISSDGSIITINQLPQTSFALLKKAMNISGDFILKYTYNITELTCPASPQLNGGWIAMALSLSGNLFSHSSAETIQGSPKNQTFIIYERRYTGGTYVETNLTCFRDMRYPWASAVRMDWAYATLNTEYNVTLSRVNNTMSVSVYQGETLVYESMLNDVDTQFSYFYPVLSLGGGVSTYYASGIFKNFQILVL
jgi:hypothetical protein